MTSSLLEEVDSGYAYNDIITTYILNQQERIESVYKINNNYCINKQYNEEHQYQEIFNATLCIVIINMTSLETSFIIKKILQNIILKRNKKPFRVIYERQFIIK